MGNRKGTRDDLAPCKGVCGRMTYASTVKIDDAPEAVMRYKQGYCGQCWDRMQQERPMTPEEVKAAQALEAYMEQRRKRMDARQRGLEQFRRSPLFGTIEINYNQPIKIHQPVVTEDEKTEKPRKPRIRKEGGGRKLLLDYTYAEGTIRYSEVMPKCWGYVITATDGEVLAKNDYGYRALKYAKKIAKEEASDMGWTIDH